jgi:hypothetical protein
MYVQPIGDEGDRGVSGQDIQPVDLTDHVAALSDLATSKLLGL